MKLQDFLDLGFEISQTYNDTKISVKVCKEEELYKQVFEFAKTHSTWDDVANFARSLKCSLGFVSYQGNELTGISLSTYRKGRRYSLVANEGVRLCVDVVDDVITSVDDMYWYFNSCSNYSNLYNRTSIYDDTKAKSLIETIYIHRLHNAQDIRNHYNKEIKSLKRNYKSSLEKAKIGLDFLKQFGVK